MNDPVTGLYVPGDRPDRFMKAVSSGADLVVLDLEDAVRPDRKELARAAVGAWLQSQEARGLACVLQVRVNAGDDGDLEVLAQSGVPCEVRLPKVESTADLDRVARALPGTPITALLESAKGVLGAPELAAHRAVTRIALGEADLRSQTGGADPVVAHARVVSVLAAAGAGLPAPMLSVFPDLLDGDGLRADTLQGTAFGLFGRMAVHPRQLPIIASVFQPSASELRRAEQVLRAVGEHGVAVLPDGSMVDEAMRAGAERILARGRPDRTPS